MIEEKLEYRLAEPDGDTDGAADDGVVSDADGDADQAVFSINLFRLALLSSTRSTSDAAFSDPSPHHLQLWCFSVVLCPRLSAAAPGQPGAAPGIILSAFFPNRDAAILFTATARWIKLPIRFVNGYLHDHLLLQVGGFTHVWVEANLPASDCSDFDPTTGCVDRASNIAVTIPHCSCVAPPVAGSFIGPCRYPMTVADSLVQV